MLSVCSEINSSRRTGALGRCALSARRCTKHIDGCRERSVKAEESFDSFAHRATGHPPYPYPRRIALEGLPEPSRYPRAPERPWRQSFPDPTGDGCIRIRQSPTKPRVAPSCVYPGRHRAVAKTWAVYSFRAISGLVIRSISGSVEAMIPREATSLRNRPLEAGGEGCWVRFLCDRCASVGRQIN
jgi:hypothetical protein